MLVDRGNGLELIEGIVDLASFTDPPKLRVRGPFNGFTSEEIPTIAIVRYTLSPIDTFDNYGSGPIQNAQQTEETPAKESPYAKCRWWLKKK